MDARTRMWGFRHVATRYLNPLTRRWVGRLIGMMQFVRMRPG